MFFKLKVSREQFGYISTFLTTQSLVLENSSRISNPERGSGYEKEGWSSIKFRPLGKAGVQHRKHYIHQYTCGRI